MFTYMSLFMYTYKCVPNYMYVKKKKIKTDDSPESLTL